MCSRIEAADASHASRLKADAQELDDLVSLFESDEWKTDGARDFPSWLAAHWQLSPRTARALVKEALALRARPALHQALFRGEISEDQCKALCVLCDEGTNDDEVMLEALPFWTIHELEREARKKTARELEQRDGGTYFRMEHTRDERFMRGEFQLHPEDGAMVLAAVEARVPQGTALRQWDHACATALVELCKDPSSLTGARPVVLLSVKDVDDVAELASGGFVSPETAKRLTCDARVQVLYTDESGRVIDTGSTSRNIPPHKRRAVEDRDGHRCTFPACDMEQYLECHHIIPFEEGGPTEVDNLLLTCWTHHKLVHEGAWSLRGDAGPDITWIRPDGTVFEPRVRVVLDTS